MEVNRREVLALGLTAMTASAAPTPPADVIRGTDKYLDDLMQQQNTDPQSPWRGGFPDAYGLHTPGTTGAILEVGAAAFVTPQSRHYRSNKLMERMKLGMDNMLRFQLPNGNSLLLVTNYNSTPDTAFMTYGVGGAAQIGRDHGAPELVALTAEWRKRAGHGLSTSGIHTPNHRWVVCSALAMLHALDPHPEYLRRIDQWLAEGIDMDEEGQYTERSSGTYNMVSNRALIITADKLKRPELLEPVRRNLNAMLYLVHPDGEVVTEISRRQDQGQRVSIGSYWFAMRYMAAVDQNPQWETLAQKYPEYASLSSMLQFPTLLKPAPSGPPPENFEKQFPKLGVSRIRRGNTSANIMLTRDSRFFQLRHGGSVIEAVRFSSAFFGKGQFIPLEGRKQGGAYVLTQRLDAGYYQPFDPPRHIDNDSFDSTRPERRRTEVCDLEQRATIRETSKGFQVRMQASGTDLVPVALELHLREGMKFDGVDPAPKVPDAYLLRKGYTTIRSGDRAIRVGPGRADHGYTQVRGALPKMAGPSLYITGYTPFDHTIDFELI